MVPSPAPTPSAIALMALAVGLLAAAAITSGSTDMNPPLSVRLGGRAAEVDRSQGREYEGLQAGDDDDLEEEEDDRHEHGERADVRGAQQHHHAPAHEEDQEVAGEQVREQPDGQRDDPHEVRDRLDDEDRAARRPGDSRRDPTREIGPEALRPYALDVVAEPHDEREDERHRDVRGRGVDRERREVGAEDVDLVLGVDRERYVPDQVRVEDEEERGADEGEPLRGHSGVP